MKDIDRFVEKILSKIDFDIYDFVYSNASVFCKNSDNVDECISYAHKKILDSIVQAIYDAVLEVATSG